MPRKHTLVPLLTLLACAPPPEVKVDTGGDTEAPYLNIIYPPDDAKMPLYEDGKARFAVAFEYRGLDFVPENAGDDPTGEEGHVHLYVGGETYYPSTAATTVVVSGYEAGDEVDVELFWASNNHVEDTTIADVVHVDIVELVDTGDTEGSDTEPGTDTETSTDSEAPSDTESTDTEST